MKHRVLAAGVVFAGWALPAMPASAQRVGLFFDDRATLCEAPILPFGQSVHVWVFAFPPPDSVIGGVAFKLQLPPNMYVAAGSLRLPGRPPVASTTGDLLGGITIRYGACVTGISPFLVAEMALDDRDRFGMRNDLRVTLVGVATDSMVADVPEILICDPGDPLGAERGRLRAPSIDAVFNCTAHCGCTTAVRPRSWSEMKFLYRER